MKIDKDLILAFDIQDTKKIINLIKEKKRKILAITPNAYEELNKNGFEDIVSPYDLNEHLHEQIAEDNILFRDKLDNINQNSSFLTLCDESFKNILVQCFSSINFFLKFIKKDTLYICLLDNNLSKKNYTEVINLILDTIILKKYGIFKLGYFFNNKKNFLIKKIVNNVLFFSIKKKNIIFNFLENKKKISKINNDIEIKFTVSSNSRTKNLFQIFKSFLNFFTSSNIKIIYPEIRYKRNIKLEDEIDNFLKFIDMDALKFKNKNLISFLSEIKLYETALINFLDKRFKNLSLRYLVADFLTWMDPNIIAKFLNKKNLKIFLCSHGNIDSSNDPLAKAELLSLARGLNYSEYASSLIAQNPAAYEISKELTNSKKINIIKSHPVAYRGKRAAKKINQDNIKILFAGTYKVFLSRPYIYQGSYQFLDTIKKISKVFKNFNNVEVSFNIRTNDEINNNLFNKILEDLPRSKIFFNSNIENLMQNNHLLITNFSTLIDEFSYLKKPVIILNDFIKYECYKHFYSQKSNNNFLDPVYYLGSAELNNKISDILEKIRENVKVNKPNHIWEIDEAIDSQTLLKTINE